MKFEFFDVLEGVAAEEASDVFHGISEIYSFQMDAENTCGDVGDVIVVVIVFGVNGLLLVIKLEKAVVTRHGNCATRMLFNV